MDLKTDVAIVGGGLAGCLMALKLSSARPDLQLLLLEGSGHLGGHHTWSFHESDLTPESLVWIKPFVTKSWSQTNVDFPRVKKTLSGAYHSVRSNDLAKYVSEKLGESILLNSTATRLSESHVELENGSIIAARCVLDARGLAELPAAGTSGFQKFIGLDLQLETPHGLSGPVIIDATCPQLDGFRFFYLLPFDEKRLLVEETYYSDTPDLNTERITRSIRSYAERRGWKVAKVEREERGVLPIPMTSAYVTKSVGGDALPIGMRGGYFHATTGFSFPDAVRVAEFLSTVSDLSTQAAREGLMKFRRTWLGRQKFYRMLNRLLFYASEPSLRYGVLQHFYEQTQDVIERFYAGRTTWGDRFRILSGRPPVPLDRALRSFSESSVQVWTEARAAAATAQATAIELAKAKAEEQRPAKKPRAPLKGKTTRADSAKTEPDVRSDQ